MSGRGRPPTQPVRDSTAVPEHAGAADRVEVFVTGGTIAMVETATGAMPDEAALRALAGSAADRADIRVISNVPSASLSWRDVLELAAAIENSRRTRRYRRFVVVQGTDTLEDVAFALDLLTPADSTVVVTGAMHPASHPDYDGVQNLADAITVAQHPEYRGEGVLVCLHGQVIRAAEAHKVASAGIPAFGATGSVLGSPRARQKPAAPTPRRPPLIVDAAAGLPHVAIARLSLSDDERALSWAAAADVDGLVLEGFGAGNTPASLRAMIERLAQRIPVALSTRIRPGAVIEGAYGYPGSQSDLAGLGVIPTGSLGADKSRILITLALAAGFDRQELRAEFRARSAPADQPRRESTSSG